MKSKLDIYVINRIRQIRTSKKISQAELAFKIGVSTGYIGKVESSKCEDKYNLNLINKIAKALDVSPQEFFPKTPL